MKRIAIFFSCIILLLTATLRAEAIPPPTSSIYSHLLNLMLRQTGSTNIVINPSTDKILRLRIKKDYEIFDTKGKMVKKGSGKEIDVSSLPSGKYTIKFDRDYNQIEYFTKT